MKQLLAVIIILLVVSFAIAGTGPSIKKAEDALLGRLLAQKYNPEKVDILLKLPRVRGNDCSISQFQSGENLVFSEDYSQIAVMDKTPILEGETKE